MTAARKFKIGIDVGGTFTHAVAVDLADLSVFGKARVPTTHRAAEGVAAGVAESLVALLSACSIAPEEVVLVAHSTTQATNALLEGDTAPVGIVCLGKGLEGWLASRQAKLGDVAIAAGRHLRTHFRYLDLARPLDPGRIAEALDDLGGRGAEVFVATEAFGVDRPAREDEVVAAARERGLLASSASAISKLYGLRVRTRTAVINASMMPKMLETATRTEEAVRRSGITAPLMVMRSDGGIMDVAEMRRRPILTMLSGPAAGVAAALMYERVTDGVFLEVGGTSTDISVIRRGRPQVKSARLGGYHLYLQTLDVRTLGVAGGSMPRTDGRSIVDAGPRSAHIAGVAYAAFTEPEALAGATAETVRPCPGDPADYAVLRMADGAAATLTPTCAARRIASGQPDGPSTASGERTGFDRLAAALGGRPLELAHALLDACVRAMRPVIERLIREYKLQRRELEFVGGGGGAEALVPYTARAMGVPFRIARDADVLSAIGAALGLIRDSVERSLADPTEGDLLSLRRAAVDSVLGMGAAPESIEVTIEVDARNRKVTAIATGSTELRSRGTVPLAADAEALRARAAEAFGAAVGEVTLEARTQHLFAFAHRETSRRFFGLLRRDSRRIRVMDADGTTRLSLDDARASSHPASAGREKLAAGLADLTGYGDAGARLPDVFLLVGARLVDFTGLVTAAQILAMADAELSRLPPDEPVGLVLAGR